LRRLAKRLTREPLIHFLVLGAALFGLNEYSDKRTRVEHITITRAQIARLAGQYQRQYGVVPTATQLDVLVNNSIREEILFREATRLGLGTDDEIVRRRLVQKYEFLQQDLATPPEPTEAQLLDSYHRHMDQYQLPARVTFTHVYYSIDRRGAEGARQAADRMASKLNQQRSSRAADEGDPYPGPYDFAAVSSKELEHAFGQQALAHDVFFIEPKHWSVPMRSSFGWHTVYVSARQTGRQASFDEVRGKVRSDYLETERIRRNADAFAILLERYAVVRQ
jgi:hypothetical protein